MHSESSDVRELYREEGKVAITSKNVSDNVTYLALFNMTDESPLDLDVKLSDLGLQGKARIINMWSGENLGVFEGGFTQNLVPHASGLYKIEVAN